MPVDGQPPLEALRSLHAAGALATEFRRLPPLLNQLARAPDAAANLIRAGQLLTRVDPADVPRQDRRGLLTVAITSATTVRPVLAPLTAECARHGLLIRPHVTEQDPHALALRRGGAVEAARPDLTLWLLAPPMVTARLPPGWRAPDLAAVLAALRDEIGAVVGEVLATTTGLLVLNTMPLVRALSHQARDLRTRAEVGALWREFNTALLRLSARDPRVVVIDLEPLANATGPVSDERMALYAGVHLSDELFAAYAREVGHLAAAAAGLTRKVLVVDLDGTLWDGILGEDGPAGIAAAGTLRGEAFRAVQQLLKHLSGQGVLLAVSSKNDIDAVRAVLREHPDMVLREADFARLNANWHPKDVNLDDLAAGLNVGADSLVFADDSRYEVGLIAAARPEIAVVELDDEPASHVSRLLADGWFDVLDLTDQDRTRTAAYHADAARTELRDQAGSTAAYLRSLGTVVRLARPRPHEIGRISQLTLRTNQFNLTGERVQPAGVQRRLDDLVVAVEVTDRYGRYGIVGAVFARRDGDTLDLTNVVLSCRVFGRDIAEAAVISMLHHARDTGCDQVIGRYRPTGRNTGAARFYPTLGFAPAAGGFRHDLRAVPEQPEHLAVENDLAPTEAAS
ncbi:HAD-IIIC family phosphatase [Micromonospora sp. RP3T]|uniref:HAD-IIIC family phosphatase n=1 Tax=Micromonospora sp. RP3T TaxID=2135446 RepID=UPI003D761CAA